MGKRESKILIIYVVFVVLSEIIHILLNGAPPMYMRLIYIGVHLMFCLCNIKLIPIFVSVSMIMQNFSVVFGEFLPATIYFNIALMCYCYFQLRRIKSDEENSFSDKSTEYCAMLLFAFYILLNALIYADISFFFNLLFSCLFLACLSLSEDEYLDSLV